MLRMFLRHCGCRNFSHSRPLRNAEKDVAKSSGTAQQVSTPEMQFTPSEFDKAILVLSGRFKSKAEIPDRLTYGIMEKAWSRFRIRAGNVLMVLGLALCGYYIWKGKKMASEGESINTIYMAYKKKVLEDAQKEKSHTS